VNKHPVISPFSLKVTGNPNIPAPIVPYNKDVNVDLILPFFTFPKDF